MDLTNLAAMALTNALIILFLINEDGPANVFRGLRFHMGVNISIGDLDGNVVEYISNGTFFGDLFSCYKCFGFWSGLVIGVMYVLMGASPVSIPIIIYGGILGAKCLQ